MLKRFMTWLLRQLQGLMGALNGKRSGSPTPSQDFRDSSKRGARQASGQSLSQSPGQTLDQSIEQRDRTQAIDTSRATVPLVEHLPSKPSAEPDNRPANDLIDANLSEPDTHRRLDAAAAVSTTVETVTPSFPTSVSELLSSPPAQTNDKQPVAKAAPVPSDAEEIITEEPVTPATSVRSLKRVDSDSQLPGIHDVLPAVEPATSDEPDETLPDEILPDETSIETSERIEESTDITEPDVSASEPTPSASVEQAVLFSFDITEHAADARGDEPLAEESIDAISDVLDDKGPDSEPAELVVEDVATTGGILIDVLSNDDASSAEVAASELLGSKVETLPYPWSLPVPEAKQTQKDTQPKRVVPAAKATDIKPETTEVAAEATDPAQAIAPGTQPDTRPIKNGVVKLLFTLKEGNFHGYIEPDDGSKDILFHQKYINADIFAHLERGVPVTASVKYIEGKAYATRVDLL